VLALVLGVAAAASAQSLTSTLTGIVEDANGAVVPDAKIILTNEQSGDQRTTVTNSEGYFTIAAIPTGTYTVTIEMAGFAKWERKGITFNPGDKRTLTDIRLAAAGATAEVTIAATSETIAPIDSGEKSAVISDKQIQNLSIVGRSAAELIKILPGMTPITGLNNQPGFNGEAIGINGNGDGGKQSALGNYSANGTRTESMDIVADGAHVSDPGCNCATPVNPNPDMVQEFKVLQSNFSAENAKGPVVLNAISKSGGSEFHGTGYFYFRDYRLNSNDWQNNRNGQERTKNKYRFPGFNIGGPLVIPGTGLNKSRDKLFFFFGVEYYGQTLDTGLLTSRVPTEAMRNGDFSDRSYLASLKFDQVNAQPTGTGIVNGRLPANQIDPGGRAVLLLLPLPNVDPRSNAEGYNYIKAVELDQNMNQELIRVDYNVSNDTKFFARYNRQAELQQFPIGLWWRNAGQVPYPTPVLAENRSHSFSASLTNVLNPSMTNEVIFGLTYIDFPNAFEDPSKVSRSGLGYPYRGVFKNDLDQIPSLSTAWGAAGTIFNPGGFDPVLFARKWLVSAGDNLTKVSGTHTMKFGAYFEQVTNNQPGNGDSNGVLVPATWGGNSSGNSFADLMLGRLAQYQETTKNVLHNIGFRTFDFYAQDSWKASRKLTLEFGVRGSHLGNWYDREGVGLAVFDPTKFDPNAPIGSLPGVSWHAKDDSIPRSGNPTKKVAWMPRFGAAYDVSGSGQTVLRGGFGAFTYHEAQQPYDSVIDIAQGVRFTGICCGLTLQGLEATRPETVVTSFGALDPNDDKHPVTYSWSFTIQRRLLWNMMLETSYVGNKSVDLPNFGHANINVVPLGAMLSNPGGDENAFRPFRGYGAINLFRHTSFQNYNGWQTLLSRQTGRANFMASYTFSKALGVRGDGQGAASDNLDLRRHNYGVLAYDRTHVFNIAYSINLPNFASDFMGGNAVLRGVFDGWQVSGITTVTSGYPLQANSSNFRISGTNSRGQDLGNPRVIAGTPDTTVQPVLTCDPRKGVSGDQYINPDCFAAPLAGQNGTYIFPYLKGPMYHNHDLSMFKNFQISEHKKFQFRLSAFNFLNHPLKSLTEGNLDVDFDNGNLTADTRSRFGRVTNNKFGRRILQLAFKFYF
jgi:hypothetical protein